MARSQKPGNLYSKKKPGDTSIRLEDEEVTKLIQQREHIYETRTLLSM